MADWGGETSGVDIIQLATGENAVIGVTDYEAGPPSYTFWKTKPTFFQFPNIYHRYQSFWVAEGHVAKAQGGYSIEWSFFEDGDSPYIIGYIGEYYLGIVLCDSAQTKADCSPATFHHEVFGLWSHSDSEGWKLVKGEYGLNYTAFSKHGLYRCFMQLDSDTIPVCLAWRKTNSSEAAGDKDGWLSIFYAEDDGKADPTFSYINAHEKLILIVAETGSQVTKNMVIADVDPSKPGGGTGTLSNDSDTIDFPTLPTVTAVSTGFFGIYNPTSVQLNDLAEYMWSTDFKDNVSKLWCDPYDLIVSMHIIPLEIDSGTPKEIMVGSIPTGITANRVYNQYVEKDCGTLEIKEYYGSFLDYNPYTKVSIFIPYVGIVELDTDEVMDAKINLKYHIDLLSGAFMALLKINRSNLKSVLYHYQGNMSYPVPFNAMNYRSLTQSLINVGASALQGTVSGAMGGGLIGAAIGGVESALTSGASEVFSKRANVNKGGSTAGPSAYMDNMKPYLIIKRPISSEPSKYSHYFGVPSNITAKLSTLTGFTAVSEVILDGIIAHDDEKKLIEELLKEGVYL